MAHPYQSYLFVDIETVRQHQWLQDSKMPTLFKKRFESHWANSPGIQWDEIYNQQAALTAEFGKIVCISIGRIVELNDKSVKFFVSSKAVKHESEILKHFSEIVSNVEKPVNKLVGHNAKEFDFPFIYRRLIVNGMPIPTIINPIGKKPWEFPWEDTREIWGAGQFKHHASLDLLSQICGFESPKEVMNGAQVGEYYYSDPAKDMLPFDHEEMVMGNIASYCSGDVIATAKLYCKFKGIDFPDEIEYVK